MLIQVLHLLCPYARMSGLSTLVRAPFSYKRGGTQRYNSSSLKLTQARATHRPSSGSQVHTSSQAQYITQWSRVLLSGGPNHSKPLCVLVFGHRLARHAKRLGPSSS
jgi:hypothetical protein